MLRWPYVIRRYVEEGACIKAKTMEPAHLEALGGAFHDRMAAASLHHHGEEALKLIALRCGICSGKCLLAYPAAHSAYDAGPVLEVRP